MQSPRETWIEMRLVTRTHPREKGAGWCRVDDWQTPCVLLLTVYNLTTAAALARLAQQVPGFRMDHHDSDSAVAEVHDLWSEVAR